ncbi:hypothetical protein ACMHYB_48400 [Sorangium sp. So ce1128]
MSSIIDVVIVVDTEGLSRKYPNGVGRHERGEDFEQFFTVLVDKDHAYSDDQPDARNMPGIVCNVNDTIYFRAISKSDTAHGVIILEWADKSAGLSPDQLVNYLSIPSFRTSTFNGFTYDNNALAQFFAEWDGWKMWNAVLQTVTDIKDPHMSVQALKSTEQLEHKHIRYTLGFRVSYPGYVRDYWFDPAIKIRG